MTDYDSPWKEALDAHLEAFMAFFFPLIHREIDWSRGYEVLDKELQQVVREGELGRRLVDKLVKVWRTNGEEEWVLIHIEVQTYEESAFPRRMYVYNYRLFDRYNRQVASLAILGDERTTWRPDSFGYDLWGCTVGIRFPVVKLLDYAPALAALQANPNPFATVVLAHLKTQETKQDPKARHAWKLQLVKKLYDQGFAAKDVRQLFRFIDWIMELPEELENAFRQEVYEYEEEKRMPFMTTFERAGCIKGLLEGIELGLKLKFGPEGLRFLPEIAQLQDVDVLRTILRAIETANTPEELKQVWSS